MDIKLVGGPMDGASFEAPPSMPIYVVIKSHKESPIYKAMLTSQIDRTVIYYYFLGYENLLAEPA
ncbi:hypothetical protein KA183_04730 [bacterium]|nr:hypothetical protein [bacterium]QQR56146.1 MAG: hypothetical protein IPG59_14150 [Candidatus Melainabacteria bacterium]